MREKPGRPLVLADDNGIRPGGPPDRCFYCKRRVGEEHGPECVMIVKRVRLRYTFEVEVDVPHHWTRDNVEFHRNGGSWCASNAVQDLEGFEEALRESESSGCLCPFFKAKFLSVADETMRRAQ